MDRKRRRSSYIGASMPRTNRMKLFRKVVGRTPTMSRVHSFKRCGDPVYITNGAAVGSVNVVGNVSLIGGITSNADLVLQNHTQVRGAMQFNLAQLAAVSEITSLFENYRIKKVKLTFLFSYNSTDPAVLGTTAGFQAPVMHYAIDQDDSTTPGSRGVILERSSAKSKRLTSMFDVWVTPRAQNSVVGGVGGAGGLMPLGQWLDCDSTGINHYGLKFVIDQFPSGNSVATNNNYALTITPTFYLEAKNVV